MRNATVRLYLVVIWSILFMVGCAMTGDRHSNSKDLIEVKGDSLFKNGYLFAELRYFFTEKAPDLPEGMWHRGLAIYYASLNKLVWIYPKRGLESDIKRGHFSPQDELEWKFGAVFDVSFSPDRRYVLYKEFGVFRPKSHKYLIDY
jgi:hypothetical protein